jgi:hypothetical protein
MEHICNCENSDTTMVSEQEKTFASRFATLPVVAIETLVCLSSLLVCERRAILEFKRKDLINTIDHITELR